jgi:hypothetical protein
MARTRLFDIVEGRTKRLKLTLLADGAGIERDGIEVSNCYITGNDGTEVDTVGKFGWDADTDDPGDVYYAPAAGDFVAAKSPYRLRFELTDELGEVLPLPEYPDGDAYLIRVSPLRGTPVDDEGGGCGC